VLQAAVQTEEAVGRHGCSHPVELRKVAGGPADSGPGEGHRRGIVQAAYRRGIAVPVVHRREIVQEGRHREIVVLETRRRVSAVQVAHRMEMEQEAGHTGREQAARRRATE
jgi:hypothetical protein